ARARASRFGPGSTSTRSERKAAPRLAAAASTPPASAPEPGRRPWSTCTAVTRQPAATASTSRAMESAPPETAHVTSVPGPGNEVLGRSASEELTCAHNGQQLGNRADPELPADTAQAGVDV